MKKSEESLWLDMDREQKSRWEEWEKETLKLAEAFKEVASDTFKFAPKTNKMRKQEKYKTALIDRMMVRIPLHLHNRLEARMFEENKTKSKVIREALEKAL
jgi:hypothetical protein